MRRPASRILLLCCSLALVGLAGLFFFLSRRTQKLPYHDQFAQGSVAEWTALGGTWGVTDGAMRNASDERGAKLLTGDKGWKDVNVQADLMLLGQDGDAGILVRSSDEEEGVDAYTGYYAGLRNTDNALVLGRAQHTWREESRTATAVRVQPFRWYHLQVVAFDCRIFAKVALSGGPTLGIVALNEQHCVPSGRIGLRSYSSGGQWRSVTVQPATAADADAMQSQALLWRQSHPQSAPPPAANEPADTDTPEAPATDNSVMPLRSIADLRLASSVTASQVRVRGAVVLTSPALVLQDSTGGMRVSAITAPPLKLGDEVEAIGSAHPSDFGATIDNARLRILWSGTPVPALSVTPLQAATGFFNDSYIEVEGRLVGQHDAPDGTQVLDLTAGAQAFRAVLARSREDQHPRPIKLGSLLQLRGVCMVEPAYTHYLTPFILLLRSPNDLIVAAGPPWWNRTHFFEVGAGLLVLGMILSLLYSRIEQWRLRAVFQERERLAQEMHDTLAQSFAGIGFQLEAIRDGTPRDLSLVHQQLDLATDLVRHSHEEARRSIAALRPESLASGDLASALKVCAERMMFGGDLQLEVQCKGEVRELPVRVLDTLYRIGQEALANAVAHSEAHQIRVLLLYSPEVVRLTVSDDGRGFIPESIHRGFGLTGMRKRARSIAASFSIRSEPRHGTDITVEVPLAPTRGILSHLRTIASRCTFHVANALIPHQDSRRGRSPGRLRRPRKHAQHPTVPHRDRLGT